MKLVCRRPGGVVVVLVACLLSTRQLSAQMVHPDSSIIPDSVRSEYFFYHGWPPYGSDALSGPLKILLNKGFAVAQFQNRDRFIFNYDYGRHHVWKSIADLSGSVQRLGGGNKVLRTEVLPISFEWKNWTWAPNYFGHVLEGGMTNRRIEEWYRVHGPPPSGSRNIEVWGECSRSTRYRVGWRN